MSSCGEARFRFRFRYIVSLIEAHCAELFGRADSPAHFSNSLILMVPSRTTDGPIYCGKLSGTVMRKAGTIIYSPIDPDAISTSTFVNLAPAPNKSGTPITAVAPPE
jgi:hypothetical protein